MTTFHHLHRQDQWGFSLGFRCTRQPDGAVCFLFAEFGPWIVNVCFK